MEMFDIDYDVPIMDNRLMPMQYVSQKINADQRTRIRVQDKKIIRIPPDVKNQINEAKVVLVKYEYYLFGNAPFFKSLIKINF